MNNIDIIILTLIILITVSLVMDHLESTETFADITISDREQDTLFMYREWLKENETSLYGIHIDNFIRLYRVRPTIIEKVILPRIEVPKETNLSGSINFLEEQNKLVSRHFDEYANKIGFISENERKLNLYASTSHVDPEIIVVDPLKVMKKKLPTPVKTKQIN
jgi:hypothetical protein